jgi:hypothetical protein
MRDNNWKTTDNSIGQMCKKISNNHFIYKDNENDETDIILSNYSVKQMERCINSFGYTFYSSTIYLSNIYELYGEDANQIIAECLFEENM